MPQQRNRTCFIFVAIILTSVVVTISTILLSLRASQNASAKENVISPELVKKVNNMNAGWRATLYPRFANMSFEEASRVLCSKGAWANDNSQSQRIRKVKSTENIPENFDSRTQWPGSIHPIRDQGACGSCWAFGASETLSDRFAIATSNRINVVLSVQQLVDCVTDNNGCQGGRSVNTWNYMVKVGLLDDGCYGQYNEIENQCRVSPSTTMCPSQPSSTVRFYHAKNAYKLPARNIPEIQTEIMTYGPVQAGFTVYRDFFAYRGGVYVHTTGAQAGGHAIKIIGWGRENGTDYWLCANSWGSKWGLHGYFKILRGTDECGIEDRVSAGQAKV